MTTNKRNIIGTIGAFALGVVFGALATIFMVFRELWQSYRYGFEIESDDLIRYSLSSSLGAIVNLVLMLIIF